MSRYIFLFCAVFAGLSFKTDAQSKNNGKKWTLEDCIQYASNNNLQIQSSAQDVELNKNRLYQAKGRLLPDLTGSGSQQYVYGKSIDPFTNQFTTQPVKSNNFQLASTLTIFNGFQSINSIRQAQIDVKASNYNLEQMKYTTTLNVIDLYTQILYNMEILQKSKYLLQTTNEQLARTEKLVKAGALPESSALNIASQKATDELNIVKAENNLSLSKLNLVQLLQIPLKDTFEIETPVIDSLLETHPIPFTSEDIYHVAENSQPGIKNADLNIARADLGVTIARGIRSPSITLQGGVLSQYSSIGSSTSYVVTNNLVPIGFLNTDPTQVVSSYEIKSESHHLNFSEQVDQNKRGFLIFNLNIPIFNHLQTSAAINNAKIVRNKAVIDAKINRTKLRQSIELAYVDAKNAQKNYASTQKQVESLRELLRVTQERVNNGVETAVDYIVAKNNLNKAESDFITAKYQYFFNMKILDFYMNKPLMMQ